MATVSDALASALEHHQAGRFVEAERTYRQILATEPGCADAWHLLGALALQCGQSARAVELIHQAVQLTPNQPTFLNNLGEAYRRLNKNAEAIACFRHALALQPLAAESHNNLGLTLLGMGELDEAVACLRRALELNPHYPDAHNNLGNALYKQGRFEEAIPCYRQALSQQPGLATAHNNLGLALQAQGKGTEAVRSYRTALELRPDLTDAHNNLGNALKTLGRTEEALASYRRALELQPEHVEALNNLGNLFQEQKKFAEAVSCYQHALQVRPHLAESHANLGDAYHALGRLDEAIACYRKALDRQPALAGAHTRLGTALEVQGRLDAAIDCYQRALQLDPNSSETCNNLGHVYHRKGLLRQAGDCFERALQIRPDFAEALLNLGGIRRLEGRIDEGLRLCEQAIQHKPDCAEAYATLGAILQSQARVPEALAALERALELKPESAGIHSTFLNTLHYGSDTTPARLRAAHEAYEKRHAARFQAEWRPHDNPPDPHRPLRLGFISPHFARRPVGYFLIRVLENLDRRQCSVHCYSESVPTDDLTLRFQKVATSWLDILGQTDEAVAQRIRADRIDILFDLAGHTGGNRLLAFARKPAPVQISWLDYEGTTGLRAMDYLLADPHEIPPEAEPWYAEKVLRMPDDFVCYEPPDRAPAVSPLPALATGQVTFGSFNLPGKVGPQVVATWARILQRLPDTRLLLKYHGLDDAATRARFQQQFLDHGVAAERVLLEGWSPYAEFLTRYHQIDIALDPFPYTGGLTTCEALWMGVPVITCPLEIFASRHGLTHLTNVGLTETIARDLDHYVELACALAQDLPRLEAIRARLREQVRVSPLCDGPRFAANLLQILRDVWREWAAKKSSLAPGGTP